MVDTSHLTDEALIELTRSAPSGDLSAFDQLVVRHREGVVANCRYLTRSDDDAQDLAQEVFVKVFFGLSDFEGRAQFRTWLRRVKVNHCLNFIEKRAGKKFVNLDDPELDGAPELSVAAEGETGGLAVEERERISRVLDAIPDSLRIPLILCDVDELPYQDIADLLGIGLSAVKMRIKRAREEFRRRFAGGEPAPRTRPRSAQAASGLEAS